ncbi:CDP-alcohol phosphatidyltransferase family protein [Rufibacter hautae]|nr:CDP-alcohol phosphatidyltransferase family protein [Rufibacter hautae]
MEATGEKMKVDSTFEKKKGTGEKAWKVFLQQGIYKIVNPFVRLLIRLGFTPNAVTTTGFILNVGVAVIFVVGGESENRDDFSYVGWAGFLIMMAGLFDMLDGQVARMGNMGSTFGALYDSVLDRYSELIMFLGICYYLMAHHYFLSSLFAFIAMIGSMMVSYTRARAEGLGVECKGGFFQRPERVVLIALAGMFCGLTAYLIGGDYKLYVPGLPFHIFETMSVFTIPITVLAIFTNITAFTRLMEARKALELKERNQTMHQ